MRLEQIKYPRYIFSSTDACVPKMCPSLVIAEDVWHTGQKYFTPQKNSRHIRTHGISVLEIRSIEGIHCLKIVTQEIHHITFLLLRHMMVHQYNVGICHIF